MIIRRETVTVTGATGGAGAATASGTTTNIVTGSVVAVYLAYTDSPPATADVTIAEATRSPALSILTVTDANTDGWFYPDWQTVNSGIVNVFCDDYLTVTIAQANDNDGVTATIVWVEG